MSSPLLRAFDSLIDQAKDALWAVSSCVCQQSAKVKINGRTCTLLKYYDSRHPHLTLWSLLAVKIVKVLGEGGFSFVYLAQDETSGVSRLPSFHADQIFSVSHV